MNDKNVYPQELVTIKLLITLYYWIVSNNILNNGIYKEWEINILNDGY